LALEKKRVQCCLKDKIVRGQKTRYSSLKSLLDGWFPLYRYEREDVAEVSRCLRQTQKGSWS